MKKKTFFTLMSLFFWILGRFQCVGIRVFFLLCCNKSSFQKRKICLGVREEIERVYFIGEEMLRCFVNLQTIFSTYKKKKNDDQFKFVTVLMSINAVTIISQTSKRYFGIFPSVILFIMFFFFFCCNWKSIKENKTGGSKRHFL